MDCFLDIDRGQSEFAFVSAEQALLAAPLVSDNVVVIGEIKEGMCHFYNPLISLYFTYICQLVLS